MKQINLVLQDGLTIPCEIYDNYTANWWYKQSKHFQHLEVLNHPLYNPYTFEGVRFFLSEVKKYSNKFSLGIDMDRPIDQSWCNYAHRIYEINCAKYCKDTDLQIFHMSIHKIEQLLQRNNKPQNRIYLDFFSKGGLLSRKINEDDKILKQKYHNQGSIILTWAELGKTPLSYYNTDEPKDQNRVNELVKPFTNLHINISIMTEDGCRWDADNDNMIDWWKTYEQKWIEHWRLVSYDHRDYTDTICIGKVSNIELLKDNYKKGNMVKQIMRLND